MANRRKKPKGTTSQPGYWAAKHAIAKFGSHVIDGRSRVAHALDEFRDKLIADLGGAAAVSQQQRVIIDVAVKTYLMLSSLDNYLLSLGSLVNRTKRSVWPVVKERIVLADSLTRQMSLLGLARVTDDGGGLPPSWVERVKPYQELEAEEGNKNLTGDGDDAAPTANGAAGDGEAR